MAQKDSILVVVDPTTEQQNAVSRGAHLAEKLGYTLRLLICHYEPGLATVGLFDAMKPQELRELALARELAHLNAIARQHAASGLTITSKAVWDTPLYEGIIREALRSQPRLVIKDTHFHSAVSRTLFTNTDWHLIRDCPMPLWLVKSAELPSNDVLAAVDPLHEHDKPASLDDRILDAAGYYAQLLGGKVHVFHGYDTAPAVAGASAGPLGAPAGPVPVGDIIERLAKKHRQALQELLADRDLPEDHIHLKQGPPVRELCATAERLHCGLAVMGAVSRSLLQRATIGSTAEQALDRLPCDVLIVKKPGFESDVTYRPQPASFTEVVNA